MNDFEITLTVKEVTGNMYLRQYVGEGKYGEQEFTLDCVLPSMSPYVKIGDRAFIVSIADITQAVLREVLGEEQP
jgi:hypothetical protein